MHPMVIFVHIAHDETSYSVQYELKSGLAKYLFCKIGNNKIMKRNSLGEFEEIVLLIVAILGDEAYGVRVMEEVKTQTGRNLSISAIHATLQRLEDKGLVISHMGGATSERGGRRKRFFKLNAAGSHMLIEVRKLRDQLWQQVPDELLNLMTN